MSDLISHKRSKQNNTTQHRTIERNMLQIRLSRPSSGDGGGGAARSSLPVETVTVACPEHLVLADLPVAKSLGAVTFSAAASVRSCSRRSRRNFGQKVHFCIGCNFPIAIYGRLIPCEHAFCLACARSDSSCYLCDERIQKIQTLKMMEGVYICAAPHCLKSFLKRDEFESHVKETHAELLRPDVEREVGNETDATNTIRLTSADPHNQSLQPESSTARAPPRPGFSPSSNSQPQDHEERPRRHQSRDQTPSRPPLQPRPPPYHSQHQHQPGDRQPDSHTPVGSGPSNWFHHPQNFESQSGRHADQLPPDKQAGITPDSPFSNFPSPHPQPPNYPHPANASQAIALVPSFTYPPLPTEGSQPYYSSPFEMQRSGLVPENGSEQGSVLGIPPAPTAITSFPDNFPRPWGMPLMSMPYPPMQVGQGIPEGFSIPMDTQGGVQYYQGEGLPMNPPLPGKESVQQGSSADRGDGKGVLAPLPMPLAVAPPLPPMPPPMQQLSSSNLSSSGGVGREGQVFGWQSDSRGFGNAPE